jgi:hypothetical protein
MSERVKSRGATRDGIYAVALAVSISLWFIAIRSPLWLDETWQYWDIKDGLSKIWPRQFASLAFPAYSFILWLWTKIAGTSELALRIPSVFAMLGAVYLLYRIARELFEREIAMITVIVFSVNTIVIFSSIDARAYAFATLVTNAAILILLRLRRDDSNLLAALFGLTSACIVYFQYLFAAILPAFVLCFFIVKAGNHKALWRQFGIAAIVFALAFLPVIPGLHYVFASRSAHVAEIPPKLRDLAWTFAPGWLPFVFAAVGLASLVIAALKTSRIDSPKPGDILNHVDRRTILLCVSLAFVPVLLLYGISKGTSIEIFAVRHRLVAVPGIALCWALVISLLPLRKARLTFCVALAAATAFTYLHTPFLREHDPTWKYALAVAEKNASADGSPVLMCSPFIEGKFEAMPLDSAKESRLFAPLAYYKLSVPVVPMPYSLNDEAVRTGSNFLREETVKHQRFLALADPPSYGVLDWLTRRASGFYDVHKLGVFDDTKVLEFVPLPENAHR